MMYKFLIPLAAAASTLAIAAPASAQYYPQQQPYAAPYAYGHAPNQMGMARNMQARVQGLRHQIRDLDRRNMIDRGQARTLDRQAMNIERQLMRVSRYRTGQPISLERRLVRLEQRVQRQVAMNMNRGYRYGNARRW